MRQPVWFRGFRHFLFVSAITFQIVIRVECGAEYRTIDYGVKSDSQRIPANRRSDQVDNTDQENDFSPRTGRLDIRSRYWARTEPEYPEEPEETSSTSYATISADDGEYVTSSDPNDGQHAYVTVDRMDKEHMVTINMPRMSGRNHLFKKFVIQPVIQYVVQYDKNSPREGLGEETAASTNYEEYEGGQGQDRMRRGHANKVDRYFNDIDANFDSYWGAGGGEGGGGGYQGEGNSEGRDGGNSNGAGAGVNFEFGINGGDGYSTTNQVYQPPRVNAQVSSGGYGEEGNGNGGGAQVGGNNGGNDGGGGFGGMNLGSAMQVSSNGAAAQNHNQQQNPIQTYGPPNGGTTGVFGSGFSVTSGHNGINVMGQLSSGVQNGGNSGMGVGGGNGYQSGGAMSQGSPNGMMLMQNGGVGAGQGGVASLSGGQMGMGPSQGLGSLYGVPGMTVGQPLGPQQMMMSMPQAMAGAVGSASSGGGAMTMTQPAMMQAAMMGPTPGMMQGGMGAQQQTMMQGQVGTGQQQVTGMMPASMAMGQQQASMMANAMAMGQPQTTVAQTGMPVTMGQTGGINTMTSSGASGMGQNIMMPSVATGSTSAGMAIPNQMLGTLAQSIGGMVNTATAGAMLMSALAGGPVQMVMPSQQNLASGMGTGAQIMGTGGMTQGQIIGAVGMSQMSNLGSVGGGVASTSGTGSSSSSSTGLTTGNTPSSSYGPPATPTSSTGNTPSPSYGPPTTSTSSQSSSSGGESSSSMDDEPRPPRGNRGKKPGGGRGKPRGSGGKSLLSSIQLPKLPSSIGGHLSFMFSSGFGKGRRGGMGQKGMMGGNGGGGGGTSSKPSSGSSSADSDQPAKNIDKEQVSDHILNILGLTVHHPPASSRDGGSGSTASNNSTSKTNPILLWEREGNRASLNHLTSHIHAATREEVVAHLPVSEEITEAFPLAPTLQPQQSQKNEVVVDNVAMTTMETLITTTTTDEDPLTTVAPQIENVTSPPSTPSPPTTEAPRILIATPSTPETPISTSPPPNILIATTTSPPKFLPSSTPPRILIATPSTPSISTASPTPTTTPLPMMLPTTSQPFRNHRKPKNLVISSHPTTLPFYDSPLVFLTPPPPSSRSSSSSEIAQSITLPTTVTVFEEDTLQEYINHNLSNNVVSLPQTPNDPKSPPKIQAFYADAGYRENPVKLAEFDPWIYDALQAAFQPGQIDDNGVFFEALKRKKRRRSRVMPTLLDIRPSRSREFHHANTSLNPKTPQTPNGNISVKKH